MRDDSLYQGLIRRGVSRRDFMKFCSAMAATLALPVGAVSKIAEALEKAQKPYVVWLEFSDCCGDSEATLRASHPTIAQIVLDIISLEYHETIMAPSGKNAEKSLMDVVKNQKGKYIAIVEGAIPMKDGGIYCTIGGKTALSIAREVCGNAAATLAIGSCAAWGGIPSANPNPTGAVGLKEAVPGATVVNLPGCPVNPENLTATIVHFLTFGSLPQLGQQKPSALCARQDGSTTTASAARISTPDNLCGNGEMKAHRQGWCLYEMGCKGPEAYLNCPTIKYNEGTSWPIQGGHGCIACAADHNWDTMTPFYRRLPHVPGFGVESTADKIGAGLAVATAVGLAAHGIGRAMKPKDDKEKHD